MFSCDMVYFSMTGHSSSLLVSPLLSLQIKHIVGLLSVLLEEGEVRGQAASHEGMGMLLRFLRLEWASFDLKATCVNCLCNIATDGTYVNEAEVEGEKLSGFNNKMSGVMSSMNPPYTATLGAL